VYGRLKTMCEEVVFTQFKILFKNMPGGTEENHEKI
jgi:hypothetical protein